MDFMLFALFLLVLPYDIAVGNSGDAASAPDDESAPDDASDDTVAGSGEAEAAPPIPMRVGGKQIGVTPDEAQLNMAQHVEVKNEKKYIYYGKDERAKRVYRRAEATLQGWGIGKTADEKDAGVGEGLNMKKIKHCVKKCSKERETNKAVNGLQWDVVKKFCKCEQNVATHSELPQQISLHYRLGPVPATV